MQGFRTFKVQYGEGDVFLTGPAYGDRQPLNLDYPSTEAICGTDAAHRAPHPDCGCGYNAFSEPSGAVEYQQHGVMADVWGHDQVDVYSHGFRSRRLRVQAFYHPNCTDCVSKPAEVAVVGNAANWKADWLKGLSFHCAECAVSYIHNGQTKVMPVGEVLKKLADKFGAGIYSAEVTKQRMDAYPQFQLDRQRAVNAAKVEAQAEAERQRQAAERRRELGQQRDARKSKAKAAQMGLGV